MKGWLEASQDVENEQDMFLATFLAENKGKTLEEAAEWLRGRVLDFAQKAARAALGLKDN